MRFLDTSGVRPFVLLLALGGALTLTPAWAATEVGAAPSGDLEEPGDHRRREARRVSLLIGIGEYEHRYFTTAQGGRFGSRLTGTTNDVRRLQTSLRGWGFAEGPDQRILLDEQASKQGIEEAFAWLAERADQEDDVVVVYYSGHGSWAPDQDIDAVRRLDEEDGFDEALVPWDTRQMNDPLQLVLDDEIGHWLAQVGTRNVTVIIDACHSGTATRGEGATEFPRPRGPRAPATGTMPAGGLFSGGTGPADGAHLDHTFLAGAASHELAYETQFQGGVFGMFTYHLTEVLDAAPRGRTTYDDVIRQVHARLGVARQTPQLEGDGAALLFRVHAETPERAFALVEAPRGAPARLDVGALHGARAGAVYDVYPPDEMHFRGAAQAQVRVDSVAEAYAYVTPLDGASVPAGGRAVLARVPQGAVALDRLPLYLDPSAAALRPTLDGFEWVRVVPAEAEALAVLRRQEGAHPQGLYEVLVSGERVAPLLGDYDAGLAQGDPRRQLAAPQGYIGSEEALCRPLRRALSLAGLHLLQQSTPDLPVLDLRVLPASVVPPAAPPRTAADTAYVGELYTVWAWVAGVDEQAIRQTDVYLTAAIGGYTAEPLSLWPRGTAPALALNPDQVNRPVPLLQNVRMSPVTGVETLKVIAGTERFDFRAFVNRLPDCAAPTRGRGASSDTWASEAPAIHGWRAAERRVEILRRE
jgi:hypothetical protein